MNELIKKIPRPILVLVILVIGVAIALLSSPPGSICDVEVGKMQKALVGVIYTSKIKSQIKSAIFPRALPVCRQGNSSGACFEFFMSLRKIIEAITEISDSCQTQALSREDIQGQLKIGLQLLVQLAWGESPPDSGPAKAGWLEVSELTLFCNVEQRLKDAMDEDVWLGFRSSVLNQLPSGALNLSAEERVIRSLFSINCDSFR
jgi:hypothetical protein